MRTDSELFDAYSGSGDREALEELFERHRDEVYGVAHRILRHHADALDATQAAFLNALRALPMLKDAARFPGWLRRIAVNEAIGMKRTRAAENLRHRKAVPDPDPQPGRSAEELELLNRALDELPEDYRVPIVLHHADGLSYEEIARMLEWPRGTVGTNIHRGLERLRSSLAGSLAVSMEALLGRLRGEGADSMLASGPRNFV